MTHPLPPAGLADPHDAAELLEKYDGLTLGERLDVGVVIVQEIQARALVAIADSIADLVEIERERDRLRNWNEQQEARR